VFNRKRKHAAVHGDDHGTHDTSTSSSSNGKGWKDLEVRARTPSRPLSQRALYVQLREQVDRDRNADPKNGQSLRHKVMCYPIDL
jgi:hypothetical protein